MAAISQILKWVSELVNDYHDLAVMQLSGLSLSDKQLHFWLIGAVGLVFYILIHFAVRLLSKWGIGAISFVFTGIMLTFVLIAIEIEQQITGRGVMETMDVVAGLAGFLAFYGAFQILRTMLLAISRVFRRGAGRK